MVTCGRCGRDYPSAEANCPHCGAEPMPARAPRRRRPTLPLTRELAQFRADRRRFEIIARVASGVVSVPLFGLAVALARDAWGGAFPNRVWLLVGTSGFGGLMCLLRALIGPLWRGPGEGGYDA